MGYGLVPAAAMKVTRKTAREERHYIDADGSRMGSQGRSRHGRTPPLSSNSDSAEDLEKQPSGLSLIKCEQASV